MKLKVISTIFVVFLASASTVKAQIEAGIAGGISIPNLSASGSENNPLNTGYSSRLGPEFGLIAEDHLSKLFSIEGKIVYSSQGGKKDGLQAFPIPAEFAAGFQQEGMTPPDYLYANFKSKAVLNYLRIPISAKAGWNFGYQSRLRFSIAAGPFVGFLLSAKQVTSGNSSIYLDPSGQAALPVGPQSFNHTQNIKDQLHNANFGVDGNLGLGYLCNNAHSHKIFLEVGGNYGFVNIQKGTSNGKNNTGAATVLVGYTCRLSHS